MLLASGNGTSNSLYFNQTNEPLILTKFEHNKLNNLPDHRIEKLSQSIEIKDEVDLLKILKLPYSANFYSTGSENTFNKKTINKIDRQEQNRCNDEVRSTDRLKNLFFTFRSNLQKPDNDRSNKLNEVNSKLDKESNSVVSSQTNSEIKREPYSEPSSELDNKINRNELNYNLDDEPGLNAQIYRLNDLDNNSGMNSLENYSKNSSNHHVNNSLPDQLSSLFIPLPLRLFESKSAFTQKPSQKTTTRLPYASSLTKQLSPAIELLNSSTIKLPVKSFLNSKDETLFAQHTLPSPNSTFNVTLNNIAYPSYLRNSATVIFAIIFLLGTIGNILVSLIIFRSKELRNTTNYFLINLSIADLLVIIVCMPTVLIELHSKPEIWLLGEFMCKTIPYLEMSVAHASILTMLAISTERFYAICKPLKVIYKCTTRRAVLIILGIWIIALLATLPLLFIAKQSSATYLDGSEVQVCLTQANDPYSKSFFLIIILMFFFVPLIILVIIYVAITKKLCTKENISYAESVQMRARRQVVVMLATVIVCFFICLLPFRLFTLFLLFISAERLDRIGMETYYVYLYTSRVMLYTNSALNPILYNLISSKFRNAFVQTLLCCRTKSSANRMLIRQNTFNTTTTTMSLSGLNESLNNNISNNSVEQTGLTDKCKRNTIQTCSLKQSQSIDTNLKQLNYKRNRQASLQQFSSSSFGLLSTKDENDNCADSRKLIKQTSSILNEARSEGKYRLENVLENEQTNRNAPETANEVAKKQCTVNLELKVSTLHEDIGQSGEDHENLSIEIINIDGKLDKRKNFKDFKFRNQIKRIFSRGNATSHRTNEKNRSNSEAGSNVKMMRDESNKESNV